MQTQQARVHGLDTLRSLAIVGVIFYHILVFHGPECLPTPLLPLITAGWMGVDLFFVLSGYLIGSQLLKPYLRAKRPSLLEFYRNRLYRIQPAFLAVLALYLLWPDWRESEKMAPAWQFFTWTQNLLIDFQHGMAFSHAWSLCVEQHFYLLLPLVVAGMMRKPSLHRTAMLLVGLAVAGICLRAWFVYQVIQPIAAVYGPFQTTYMTRIYYPTYAHFDGLLAGVTLALIMCFRPEWWKVAARRGHLLSGIGAVLILAAWWLSRDRFFSATGVAALGMVLAFPVLSLGMGFLTASALSENGLLARLPVPGAKLIATLAYALYLTSKQMLHLVDQALPVLEKWGKFPWLVGYLMSCLMVAGVLYLCVERPFLLLRQRRTRWSAEG